MLETIFSRFEQWGDKLPDPANERPECAGSIICDCNRRNCAGKVVSVDWYWRRLRSL